MNARELAETLVPYMGGGASAREFLIDAAERRIVEFAESEARMYRVMRDVELKRTADIRKTLAFIPADVLAEARRRAGVESVIIPSATPRDVQELSLSSLSEPEAERLDGERRDAELEAGR